MKYFKNPFITKEIFQNKEDSQRWLGVIHDMFVIFVLNIYTYIFYPFIFKMALLPK